MGLGQKDTTGNHLKGLPKKAQIPQIVSRDNMFNYVIANNRQQQEKSIEGSGRIFNFFLRFGKGKNKQNGKAKLKMTKINQNPHTEQKNITISKFGAPSKLHHKFSEEFMTYCDYSKKQNASTLP